jgi:hypothetical protein
VKSNANRIIEIIGEGVTDVGPEQKPSSVKVIAEKPMQGVLPILVHKICNKPENMRVIRKRVSHLRGKKPAEKIEFERFQAFHSNYNGLVLVVDSDGKLNEVRKIWFDAREKSELALTSPLPMAIGVAHPCIESWLLADATAIRRGLELDGTPDLPENLEALSAKQEDKNHPKYVFHTQVKKNVSAKEKDRIAATMNDLELVKKRCPLSFRPFAEEVETHIRPLFGN